MVKYITLTDNSGQEQAIPCANLAHMDTTSATVLTIEYLTADANPSTVVINHAADGTANQWKLFMTSELEKALGSNWREVERKPTPPTAITTIVYAP
jgi:hypothetical protein